MRLKRQWWSGLVAAMLSGLVGVTAVAAAGAQFLPVLGVREGGQRFIFIPRVDGYIAYLTLLNERDGGINGVKLVWEECETVYDVTRGVECYERLKAKGPTGAAVVHPNSTPLTYALTERATHDQIPLLTVEPAPSRNPHREPARRRRARGAGSPARRSSSTARSWRSTPPAGRCRSRS